MIGHLAIMTWIHISQRILQFMGLQEQMNHGTTTVDIYCSLSNKYEKPNGEFTSSKFTNGSEFTIRVERLKCTQWTQLSSKSSLWLSYCWRWGLSFQSCHSFCHSGQPSSQWSCSSTCPHASFPLLARFLKGDQRQVVNDQLMVVFGEPSNVFRFWKDRCHGELCWRGVNPPCPINASSCTLQSR